MLIIVHFSARIAPIELVSSTPAKPERPAAPPPVKQETVEDEPVEVEDEVDEWKNKFAEMEVIYEIYKI